MGIHQMLLVGGGQVWYPTGTQLITRVANVGAAVAAFTFHPDGSITTEGNDCVVGPAWRFPITPNGGAALWVQVSKINGAYPPDPLNPVQMNVSRRWHRANESGCTRAWFATDSSMLAQYRVSEVIFPFYANAAAPSLPCPTVPVVDLLTELSVPHVLTAGVNPGGNRVGYRRGAWGDFQPNDVPSLVRLATNLNNDRLVMQGDGDLTLLPVSGISIHRISTSQNFDFAAPNSVTFNGISTDFTWITPGFDFVLGEQYNVSLT